MENWKLRQRRALDGKPDAEERTYTIKASKESLERFDKLLAYIDWCGGVGHSCTVGMDVDGDGSDRPVIEGVVTKVREDDVTTRKGSWEQLK